MTVDVDDSRAAPIAGRYRFWRIALIAGASIAVLFALGVLAIESNVNDRPLPPASTFDNVEVGQSVNSR